MRVDHIGWVVNRLLQQCWVHSAACQSIVQARGLCWLLEGNCTRHRAGSCSRSHAGRVPGKGKLRREHWERGNRLRLVGQVRSRGLNRQERPIPPREGLIPPWLMVKGELNKANEGISKGGGLIILIRVGVVGIRGFNLGTI